MVLTKVQRIVSFRQNPWLKPYNSENKQKKSSNNEFPKEFYK